MTDFLSFLGALHPEPWMTDAACADVGDPDAWFPTEGEHGSTTARVNAICRSCPVARECLDYALSGARQGARVQGIWAATTETQRLLALRERKETA